MQSKYDQVPAEMKRRIARQNEPGYRLPNEGAKTVLETAIGEVKLVAPRGYFTGTDGEFRMDHAPGGSSGGDSWADAIISAGLDYSAYCDGEQGYFKCSPAPRLDETADSHFFISITFGSSPSSLLM